jgi:N-acetylmuramoyl-L-alanine amidase
MTKDMKKAKDTRTKQQKDSLVKLLQELIYKYNKDMTIHGHNEFANKACPSFNVQKEYANL